MTVSIKRYKHSIKTFEKNISSHFSHRVELHGHKSKYNPMAWSESLPPYSKGIADDLTLIFEDRNACTGTKKHGEYRSYKVYDSIAFTLNPDGKDGLSVRFSINESDAIRYSESFSGDVFREVLNKVNRLFRDEGVPTGRETLMTILHAAFMRNDEMGISPQPVVTK